MWTTPQSRSSYSWPATKRFRSIRSLKMRSGRRSAPAWWQTCFQRLKKKWWTIATKRFCLLRLLKTRSSLIWASFPNVSFTVFLLCYFVFCSWWGNSRRSKDPGRRDEQADRFCYGFRHCWRLRPDCWAAKDHGQARIERKNGASVFVNSCKFSCPPLSSSRIVYFYTLHKIYYIFIKNIATLFSKINFFDLDN